jgi:hypothetical protein
LEQHGLPACRQLQLALRDLMQAIQNAQQGTFARPIGANQCHMLTRVNAQTHIAKGLHMAQFQAHMLD